MCKGKGIVLDSLVRDVRRFVTKSMGLAIKMRRADKEELMVKTRRSLEIWKTWKIFLQEKKPYSTCFYEAHVERRRSRCLEQLMRECVHHMNQRRR